MWSQYVVGSTPPPAALRALIVTSIIITFSIIIDNKLFAFPRACDVDASTCAAWPDCLYLGCFGSCLTCPHWPANAPLHPRIASSRPLPSLTPRRAEFER